MGPHLIHGSQERIRNLSMIPWEELIKKLQKVMMFTMDLKITILKK